MWWILLYFAVFCYILRYFWYLLWLGCIGWVLLFCCCLLCLEEFAVFAFCCVFMFWISVYFAWCGVFGVGIRHNFSVFVFLWGFMFDWLWVFECCGLFVEFVGFKFRFGFWSMVVTLVGFECCTFDYLFCLWFLCLVVLCRGLVSCLGL